MIKMMKAFVYRISKHWIYLSWKFNWWLLLPDSNLFSKFQNNFTAEFWATFSYGLLLQRFFWNSSGIFIMSIKAYTGNFSKKYQQNFLLDAIFFEQKGPFKP